ncbi:uncharacterized protein AKAME5_002010800 [Lates japonicus]|uniref:Uncharacterized protein n=1 Tax=Lates japonicus TaxID=270547 RepID=A0AAD3NC40_LATJO|nr:uncharacterized protein AKAME5_002010800 [Lates japonicus]
MAARQKPNKKMECHELQQEIIKLQNLLNAEKADNARVFQELVDTKEQLDKMESELEAEKYENQALQYELKVSQITASADLSLEKHAVALLQRDLVLSQNKLMEKSQIIAHLREQLKLSREKLTAEPPVEEIKALTEKLKLCQEKFETQLQAARQNNMFLKDELKSAKVRFSADLQREKQTIMALQEQLKLSQENFSAELQVEKRAQERLKLSQEQLMAESLEAEEEQEILRRTEEPQPEYRPSRRILRRDQVKLPSRTRPSRRTAPDQTEQEIPEEGPSETPQPDQTGDQTEQETPEEGPSETPQTETPGTSAAPRKSAFKRFRHFLGLRKPQRWKRPAVPASTSGN